MDVSFLVDVKVGTASGKPGQFFLGTGNPVNVNASYDNNHYRS